MGIKVLLVDDHKLVREGIRKILEMEPSIEVVGETDNGRLATQLAKQLAPEVVVMDISMPEMNGIDAIRQITSEMPEVRCVVLSMHATPQFVTQALGAGAKGYVLKNAAVSELLEAVTTVSGNAVYLSPAVAGVIAHDYRNRYSETQPVAEISISSRERQILQLFAEGKNTKQIAFILDLSVKTVESHRSNIMKKLNLHSLADLIKYAIRQGITSLE